MSAVDKNGLCDLNFEYMDYTENDGPYTCIKCCASTWNDCDWCDYCIEEARQEYDSQTSVDYS